MRFDIDQFLRNVETHEDFDRYVGDVEARLRLDKEQEFSKQLQQLNQKKGNTNGCE